MADEAPQGKFGKATAEVPEPVQSAPEETQKKYSSVSNKGDSLKRVGDEVLNSSSKDELKASLPKAIVVKKNLEKDVELLYASFKEYEKNHSDPEDIKRFREACNNVILAAKNSHNEIKDKVYNIYDKKK